MEREKKWVRDIVRFGSKKAADALVREYYDDIYAYVYRQTGSREDALDVTQECFLAAFRSLSSYDPKKAGLRTWLYHIASHKVIDFKRKKREVYVLMEEQEIAAVLAQPEAKIKAQYYRLSARLRKEIADA